MKKLFTALPLLLVLACGGSDSTGPGSRADAAVGVYSLKTFNGITIPGIVDNSGGVKTEILAGKLTLNADQTYSVVGQLRQTTGAQSTTTNFAETGIWTRNATAINFQPTANSFNDLTPYSGVHSGNTITQTSDGDVIVWQK